jgi:hypothetical protein
MSLRHVAGERQQERHRVLGGGDDVRLRGVGDDDPALGRLGNVDVVDTDAGAPNRAQRPRMGEQISVELGGGADQDALIAADLLGELLA